MLLHRLMVTLLCFALAAANIAPARASQNALSSPTTGTVSGLQLTNNYNSALDSLNTCNGGATAPTNQLSASPSAGNCWYNTSTGALQFYDGANWLTVGYIDATNHVWTPIVGGGNPTNVASATTANLCGSAGSAPTQSFLTITGTTTITGFGTNCPVGAFKFFTFSGALTLTYNATTMILPSAANITTAAGDSGLAVYLGSGNWQVLVFQRANGAALSSSLIFTGALFVNSQLTPSTLSTNQNNYSPTGLATANVLRLTASAAVNITGLAAPATNGQRLTLQNANNAGGFTITLTANDANSSAANRFIFPHPIGLQPLQSITVVYDSGTGGWRLEQKVYGNPYQGGFKNLRVFNVGTYFGDVAPSTPNSQIKIAADEVVLEDGSGNSVRAGAVACTIDFTTNGAGGLDTSSLASGNWYFVYVVFNPSTNTTSCLGSLQSATASITLPSGYTFAARVGANLYLTHNSITGFNRVVQYGRRAHYVVVSSTPTNTLPTLSSTLGEGSITVPTWIAKSVASYVPSTAARIDLVLYAAGQANEAVLAPNNAYGVFNSATNPPPCALSATSGTSTVLRCDLSLESSNVYTANNFSAGAFLLQAEGWEDNL